MHEEISLLFSLPLLQPLPFPWIFVSSVEPQPWLINHTFPRRALHAREMIKVDHKTCCHILAACRVAAGGSTHQHMGKSSSPREGFHWVTQHLLPATDELGEISAERLVAQRWQCKSSPVLPCFLPFPLTISFLPKRYHRTIYMLTECIALYKACNFSWTVVRI